MNREIVFVRLVKGFKLLLEFDNQEFRVFDFLAYAKEKKGLASEILNDIHLFNSVKLDGTGTIRWGNDFDFAVEFLHNESVLIPVLN